jgi:hypothetical protein
MMAGCAGVLLFYDIAFTLLLLRLRFANSESGSLFWPAVFIHAGLALWSIVAAINNRTKSPVASSTQI